MTGITAEADSVCRRPRGLRVVGVQRKELIRVSPTPLVFPAGCMPRPSKRAATRLGPDQSAWLHVNGNNVTWSCDGVRSCTVRGARKKDAAAALMEAGVEAGGPRRSCSLDADRVLTCGPEHEYFLVDRNFFFARPTDQLGRTVRAKRADGPRRFRTELQASQFGARARSCGGRSRAFRSASREDASHEVAPSRLDRADLRDTQRPPGTHQIYDDGGLEEDRSALRPRCLCPDLCRR